MKFYSPADAAHVSHSILNMQHTTDYFEAECKTPASLIVELGVSKISLLKLNIEGAEYAVMDAFNAAEILPDVVCITLDELHHEIDDGAQDRMEHLLQSFKSNDYLVVSAKSTKLTLVQRTVAMQV